MSRPACPNCGGNLFRDLAPRRTGLKPVQPGFRREFLLCQSCWQRQVVETPLDSTEAPDRD